MMNTRNLSGAARTSVRTTLVDPETKSAVRRLLALIASDRDVESAIVYGSRARGTHRPDSDTDVAVLLDGERQRFLPVKLAMSDIAYDVLLDTGIDISPLPVWTEEWRNPDNHSNPTLSRNIADEGIPV